MEINGNITCSKKHADENANVGYIMG